MSTKRNKEELIRRRQIAALKAADGAWKDEDHPELKDGAAAWVRKLRQAAEVVEFARDSRS